MATSFGGMTGLPFEISSTYPSCRVQRTTNKSSVKGWSVSQYTNAPESLDAYYGANLLSFDIIYEGAQSDNLLYFFSDFERDDGRKDSGTDQRIA